MHGADDLWWTGSEEKQMSFKADRFAEKVKMDLLMALLVSALLGGFYAEKSLFSWEFVQVGNPA